CCSYAGIYTNYIF
nr:immunoglobulin light chain junction region [Macaca mulatta]MPN65797.1 immunoglobulin light chain junction region [Macaca mulatta]MPN66045.1 immunoglobulin light chain junction region [Macaca mulatta]MPN66086.1 immunoglobulin light chain junction region [Macaca mulatta]MPN66291.1 immunoglobulin light chain junction region [Macaca mulatta]